MAGKLLSVNDLHGLIDPGDAWQLGRDGWMTDEALRVRGNCGLEDASAFELETFGVSVVDGGRGVEPDA